MFETLRHELSRRLVPAAAVSLPGDENPPMEGALRLRQDGDGWLFETVDYGTAFLLGSAEDEQQAAEIVLAYLDRPLPPLALFPPSEVDEAVAAATPHFADLRARAAEGSLLIEIPAGVVVDRIGAIDGTMFFPYGTSYEARSLPPFGTLAEGSGRHAFLTRADILVRVEVAQPWFGQAGGGLRCTLAQDFTGIRDLLVSGSLERFRAEE
ncbi:TNT domain-containing protein [Microbacterium karelineae]|uniref:TNT domain-containing protein n=1 Tax=Microbacterium karelineae TaxID=2654283 RepID=UPI0012EA0D25|nr:TNT domain-containing protein [Microbacterium karelineae]